MGMAAQAALLSLETYLRLESASPRKSELAGGKIFAMAGAGRNHVLITRNLAGTLYVRLRGKRCTNLDQDVKVWVKDRNSVYYPDATIACPPRFVNPEAGMIDNPTVIFEVLSEGTRKFDLGAKFGDYRALPSLQAFVAIDSHLKSVELYTLDRSEWVVRTFPEAGTEIPLDCVEISLAISELYEGVDFTESELNTTRNGGAAPS
jgi:Uma2 family endonuclease